MGSVSQDREVIFRLPSRLSSSLATLAGSGYVERAEYLRAMRLFIAGIDFGEADRSLEAPHAFDRSPLLWAEYVAARVSMARSRSAAEAHQRALERAARTARTSLEDVRDEACTCHWQARADALVAWICQHAAEARVYRATSEALRCAQLDRIHGRALDLVDRESAKIIAASVAAEGVPLPTRDVDAVLGWRALVGPQDAAPPEQAIDLSLASDAEIQVLEEAERIRERLSKILDQAKKAG